MKDFFLFQKKKKLIIGESSPNKNKRCGTDNVWLFSVRWIHQRKGSYILISRETPMLLEKKD
jgi:hypothetical protein